MKQQNSLYHSKDYGKHTFVWILLLVELLPLYMMFQISFKDNRDFLANPWFPSWPGNWQWENWIIAVQQIGPLIANSVFISVTGTIATMALALLAAYFFARYKMPFSNILWSALILLMLLPGVANLIPLFALLKELNLLNTLIALIIVGTAGAQVFNIFVLRNFIEDLPNDLFEAAEMDGAGHIQQIINIVIPMTQSIVGTLSVLVFLGKWNEFILPLVILRDQELFTIGVGLIYLDAQTLKDWGQVMAAYSVASIPLIIMFLFAMKLFVKGLSAGAIKG
jgi:ABC-type glycerol-3-phosphate transport system permease component